MSKRFRQLLPAQDVPANPGQRSSSSSGTPSDESGKRKRITTSVACYECRRKKARCDGQRPSCEACRKRSQECVYPEKIEKESRSYSDEDNHRLLHLLASVPEAEAIDLLRRLRSSRRLSTQQEDEVESADSSSQSPFAPEKRRKIGSSSKLTLESELLEKNPVAYPASLQPLAATTLVEANIMRPGAVRRTRSLDQKAMYLARHATLVSRAEPSGGGESSSTQSCLSPSLDLHPLLHAVQDEKPLANPGLCDSRFEDLKIGFWTNVSVSDDFAARVVSFYLETDHPLLGTFDPDLFVADLVGHRTRFCSRFLANAVLYWGCQMYTSIDPAAFELANAFCKEAEQLCSDEESRTSDSLLNLAGLQLLSLAYLGQGKDHYVLKYMAKANRMGSRLRLFGADASITPGKPGPRASEDAQSASSYTAWGIFNWVVMMSLFYQQPGLEYCEHPPEIPIPGSRKHQSSSETPGSGSSDDEQSGAEPRIILPQYMGDTFPALCGFWRIIHEVTWQYYGKSPARPGPPSSHVSLEFAERKYRELLAWAETLPQSMSLSEHSRHHVVIFHIWLHAAILDIFRPFVLGSTQARVRLTTFSSFESSPEAAFKASLNQLKRLIVLYQSKYTSSARTMLWHTALTYVANAVLRDTGDPEWRFYFLLCVYGYERLRRSYRLAEAVARGLLSMTLRDGGISASEARNILQQLEERKLGLNNHSSGDIRATFMVDLDLAMTKPDEAKVENLAQRFEEMALFQEFTRMDEDIPITITKADSPR